MRNASAIWDALRATAPAIRAEYSEPGPWRTCPPPDRGRGTGPDGVNKRSSERTAEDGTERSDVGSPGAAGYVRGRAPDEIMGGAGVQDA